MTITTIDHKAIAREKFSMFPDVLKEALKIAAERNKWDTDTWILQVKMVARYIECKEGTAEEISAAYLVPAL